jgi:hypothetical protein
LFVNDGTGVFVDEAATRLPAGSAPNSAAARMGDVDGDGDLDLFASDGYASSAPPFGVLYLNDGAGVFTQAMGALPTMAMGSDIDDVELSATPPGGVVPMLVRTGQAGAPARCIGVAGFLAGLSRASAHPGFFTSDDAHGLAHTALERARTLRDVYGTDLSAPASRLQRAAATEMSLADLHNGGASKLDYILKVQASEAPRFVLGPAPEQRAEGRYVLRVLDVDPSTPLGAANARTMSDHLAVEARFVRYRISHEAERGAGAVGF